MDGKFPPSTTFMNKVAQVSEIEDLRLVQRRCAADFLTAPHAQGSGLGHVGICDYLMEEISIEAEQ